MSRKDLEQTLPSLDFILQNAEGLGLISPIIETHCHLDYLKKIDLDLLLLKSAQLGIEKIMTIAVSPDNLKDALGLAKKYPTVYCTQGIHPHQAQQYSAQCLLEMKTNIQEEKVVAIGEIGLDYYYNKAPIDIQKEIFESQLQLAIDSHLPVVIHTRDADQDTIDILKNFSQGLKGQGVIHSFTSGPELARFALKEGFCLGFNGIITFKNATNVVQILEMTPLESILIETDAPFLTPAPHRGEENNPLYIPFVADKIAQVKKINSIEVLKACYQNTLRTFPKLALS